ncbi:MAG: hypothetical protein WAO22_01070 [bacterium]|nr:hypothetical protein [Bacillota bacterium]
MSVKGVEQVMPKVDHMGRIQKIADEGAAAERFVLELNQEIQAKRQSVPETTKAEENRIDDSDLREKKDRRSPKKRSRSATKTNLAPDDSTPGRGRRLDVRT